MLTKRLLRIYLSSERKWTIRGILCRRYHREFHECTSVTLSQVKQSLKQQKINFLDGHTCFIADCTICDGNKSKGPKIYINKTTGFFMCDKCKHAGSWSVLEKFLMKKRSLKTQGSEEHPGKMLDAVLDYQKNWDNLKENFLDILDVPEDDYLNILGRLSISNISRNDIAQLNCIYDKTIDTLYFPLVAFQNSVVGHKSLCIKTGVELTDPSVDACGVICYKKKHVRTDGTAVLVLTVQDLLALISKGISAPVICLPYNTQHLPQQLLPNLEAYKKLVLWFDNDEPSWDTARQFAKKLGEKRCFLVRPTDFQPRPKVASTMGYDLNKILQNAQPIWHKSVTTFQNIREDILSDLQNTEKVQGVKWKRYPTLNRILKGHRRGEFTVLTGPTGCGKTTFMSEYSLDLAMQGVNTLWGSFEIRNTRLARTMLQQMAGVQLNDHLNKFDEYADAFEKLPIYFLTFHGQQSIKVVMDAVEHATYVHDIAHVIIDNVQFMMGTLDEKYVDRFWKQDKIIACFRTFATKFNCHVTLVIHPRKERHDEELTTSSIFGSAKASQEADNILIIQDRRLTSLRGKKYLQVAKNRYSGDLGVMLLEFDKASLSYGQRKKKAEGTSTRNVDTAEKQNVNKKRVKKMLQDTDSS